MKTLIKFFIISKLIFVYIYRAFHFAGSRGEKIWKKAEKIYYIEYFLYIKYFM